MTENCASRGSVLGRSIQRTIAGHLAVERLEHHTRVTVITQNIDGLQQSAGNTIVHEIHGSLFDWIEGTAGEVLPELVREITDSRK